MNMYVLKVGHKQQTNTQLSGLAFVGSNCSCRRMFGCGKHISAVIIISDHVCFACRSASYVYLCLLLHSIQHYLALFTFSHQRRVGVSSSQFGVRASISSTRALDYYQRLLETCGINSFCTRAALPAQFLGLARNIFLSTVNNVSYIIIIRHNIGLPAHLLNAPLLIE